MPIEIFDENEFLEIAKRAHECRVKRGDEIVKLKLRTKKRLYTIKLPPEKADELLSKIECPKREF